MRKNKNVFGTLLKKYRQKAKYNQQQLSIFAKIDKGHISRLERGKIGAPSERTIDTLSDALKLSSNEKKTLYEAAGHSYKLPAAQDASISPRFAVNAFSYQLNSLQTEVEQNRDWLYELGLINDPEITKSYQKALSAINEYKSLVSKKLGK